MSGADLIVIGASAGGLEALSTIVEELPPNLPAGVLVVMHSSSNGQSVLPQILARVSQLPVAFARHDEPIEPGRIYVAPPDLHLIVGPNGLLLVNGPRENGFRPSIDPLFRTAAREYGGRVIGVILSGALSDGTYGLSVVKHFGGTAVVQDPADAVIPGMPASALRSVEVDHVAPAGAIAPLLSQLTDGISESRGVSAMPRSKDLEPQLVSEETEVADMKQLFGPPSGLTCPDCGGALWEVQEGRVVRYQCHVGHQYAPENLDAGQRDQIDGALWSAIRVLEEHAELKTRMATRAADGGLKVVADGFHEGARDAHRQAQRIRAVLLNRNNGGAADAVDSTGRSARSRAARKARKARKAQTTATRKRGATRSKGR